MAKLTVGQLAEKAGITRRTIRFYEEAGLLFPERDVNGYRQYTEQHLVTLEGIKQLRATGYSLKDIVALVQIKCSKQPRAEKIQAALELIDSLYAQLLAQRQAIDTALHKLEAQRQEFLEKLEPEEDISVQAS